MKPKTPYAIWVGDNKYFGNMKRWQAYYLAFHLWVVMLVPGNKRKIKVAKEL